MKPKNRNGLILKNKFTFEDIMKAYLDCRKRKRNKEQALDFECNLISNLQQLLYEINSGTYEISHAKVFVVTDPKPREIWAANFRDRIVHHLIYNCLKDYYEKEFIYDTYSCITGRGTLKCGLRAYEFVRKASQNFQNEETYYAKIDIKNYFVSINKNILWEQIKSKIGEDSLTSKLVHQNIFYNPTKNFRVSGNSQFDLVPFHKSLFHINNEIQGLPIGNITSQFYGNIYLDGLDHFCKEVLKIKYYIRYVDDILIISNSKEELKEYVDKINSYLKSKLKLQLHENKIIINKTKYGFTFVGSHIKHYRIEIAKRSVNRAFRLLQKIDKNILCKYYIECLQSYLGMMCHYNNFNIRKSICKKIENPYVIAFNRNYTKVWFCLLC